MDTATLFPPEAWKTGEDLKEDGVGLVLSHNGGWYQAALESFLEFRTLQQGPYTCEDFKDWTNAGSPKHPNGWGAIWNAFGKRKLMKPTGRFVKSKKPSSHCAMIQLWENP